MLNCRTQNKEPNIGSAFQRLKLQLIREREERERAERREGVRVRGKEEKGKRGRGREGMVYYRTSTKIISTKTEQINHIDEERM